MPEQPSKPETSPILLAVGVLLALLVAWKIVDWLISAVLFWVKFLLAVGLIAGVVTLVQRSKGERPNR